MILCFCLSGLMECHSCKALVVGGGGEDAFCKSEFLTFKIHLFMFSRPCLLSEVYPNIWPVCL